MRDKLGRFVKGHPKPKNAYSFPKGNQIAKGNTPNKGSFKKDHIPWIKGKHPIAWNKGKKFPEFTGSNHPNWKGGTIGSDGSKLVRNTTHPFCNKSGYILEHRLVVESQIGRYLTKKEVVHHLNEIRDDNRPENLMGFINDSVHKRFHKNPDTVNPSEIIFDGRNQ